MVYMVEILRISPLKYRSFSFSVFEARRTQVRLTPRRTKNFAENPPIPLAHSRVAQVF